MQGAVMTSGIAVHWHDYAMIARYRAKLLENPTDIILSGQKGLLINDCTKPLRGSFLAGILCPFIPCDTLRSLAGL
jgi:hypothetical protein